MDKTFEILELFLAQSRSDVAGRALEPLPAEVEERLRTFAEARASAQDRAELAALLKAHPEWVGLLARQIKAQNPVTDSPRP